MDLESGGMEPKEKNTRLFKKLLYTFNEFMYDLFWNWKFLKHYFNLKTTFAQTRWKKENACRWITMGWKFVVTVNEIMLVYIYHEYITDMLVFDQGQCQHMALLETSMSYS